jgi:hypothetical protein
VATVVDLAIIQLDLQTTVSDVDCPSSDDLRLVRIAFAAFAAQGAARQQDSRRRIITNGQSTPHIVRPQSLGFLVRLATISALLGRSLIIVKLEDHDIRAPILGMSREVARSRHAPVLLIPTSNRHDLPRTVLLDPLLDQVNCVREPADKGRMCRRLGRSEMSTRQ